MHLRLNVLKPFQRLPNHRRQILGWSWNWHDMQILKALDLDAGGQHLNTQHKKDFARAGLCCLFTLNGEMTMPLYETFWSAAKHSRQLWEQGLGRMQRTWNDLIFLETTANLSSPSVMRTPQKCRNFSVSTAVRISGFTGHTSCFALCLIRGSVLCCYVIIFSPSSICPLCSLLTQLLVDRTISYPPELGNTV